MQNKWVIVTEGGWVHHIVESDDWQEALISHAKWCGFITSDNLNIYKIAFEGFSELKQAIELYNIMHRHDEIVYMSKITDEDYYEGITTNESN